MKKFRVSVLLTLSVSFFSISNSIVSGNPSEEIVPGQYIVVLTDSVQSVPSVANEMAASHGLALGHIYRYALKGFSARIPSDRLEILNYDPRVKLIDADRVIHAMGKPGGTPPPTPPPQVLPTGIDRIDAELNTTSRPVDVDIAILDTGIDLGHPDLNVISNVTFLPTKNGNDDNGHGTHVAGIAAAKDDAIGVVGVASGARLWAVKVLDRRGNGTWSGIIAGIDYVTQHASEIEVANMSLGGSGTDVNSSLRQAINNSVAAGVTYIVAAGNDARDAMNFVPAAYDSVITVSAIADSDGQPGHLGSNTSYGADDTFATFSNFGADVDVAAPGVNIYSTWKGATYSTISGTSMSAPHVTGAAALYISNHPELVLATRPAVTRQALIDLGITQDDALGRAFTGDPDQYPEPLVDAYNL